MRHPRYNMQKGKVKAPSLIKKKYLYKFKILEGF